MESVGELFIINNVVNIQILDYIAISQYVNFCTMERDFRSGQVNSMGLQLAEAVAGNGDGCHRFHP